MVDVGGICERWGGADQSLLDAGALGSLGHTQKREMKYKRTSGRNKAPRPKPVCLQKAAGLRRTYLFLGGGMCESYGPDPVSKAVEFATISRTGRLGRWGGALTRERDGREGEEGKGGREACRPSQPLQPWKVVIQRGPQRLGVPQALAQLLLHTACRHSSLRPKLESP